MAESHLADTAAPTPRSDEFQSTHWSVILAAGDPANPRAEAALEELCRAYWYPLYVFARRRGQSPEEAEDLTQKFFLRLIGNQLLCGLKREGGKFRAFLLQSFKCFLINEWHHEHAQKRGGGKTIISIDDAAEARYRELLATATPDALFEREWAWTVLSRTETRLREDYAKEGKSAMFQWLRGYLPGAERAASYAETSAALQMNEPAVRMAVHRFRRRYSECLRQEIKATVTTPEQIDEEIRFLIAAASA